MVRAGTPSGARILIMALLELKNLHVALEDGTEIVKGVDLAVNTNETHAVMGPNGSGKSTLAYALMGHPAYEITEGELLLDGEDLRPMSAHRMASSSPSSTRTRFRA
jgi:Fe-S cluster assembly ATP-binding protein